MPTALPTAGLASQSPQGVGARLVRRLGGAVRSAIISGIILAGARRRPAVPQTSRDRPAAQDPEAPSAPSRVHARRRPRTALPAPLSLPPLLARLLARRHCRPAAASRPAYLNRADTPFTPEAFPQLSPKACAVLNTPVKDCDPKTLELLVSALVQHINQVMSPEARITDPAARFPDLWHRISTMLDDTKADTSLPPTPQPVPATPANAIPDAPLASPHPPAPPTTQWTNLTPRPSPGPLSDPPTSGPPADAAITAAVPANPPDTAAPSGPVVRRCQSFLYHTQPSARWRRSDSQPSLPRRIRVYLCASVVPFSCYHYAACTGPP